MATTMTNDPATRVWPSSTSNGRHRGLTINHDPTSAVAVVEGVTLVIIFLGALVANLMAMTAILRDKLLRRNLHNWLILNLIINDLGVTITSMTFSIVSVFDHGYFLLNNDIMCLINGTGAVGFSLGNFATILAISVDRYLTVVWSTRFPPTKSRTVIFIVLCYAVSFVNVLPPFFEFLFHFEYHPDTHHCSPVWEVCLYYIMCLNLVFGISAPAVMAFCYIGVVWTLRKQELQLRSFSKDLSTAPRGVVTPPEGKIPASAAGVTSDRCIQTAASFTDAVTKSPENCETCETVDICPSTEFEVDMGPSDNSILEMKEHKGHAHDAEKGEQRRRKIKKRNHQVLQRNLRMDKRVALTGFLLVMTTVVCWAPYFIVHSCFIPIDSTHWMGVVTMWLCYSNSLLDPLIYSFMNRRVRAKYQTMLSSCQRMAWKSVRTRISSAFRIIR